MNLNEFASLLRFANPFQKKYSTDHDKTIRAKPSLTANLFTRSMLQLVGSTNYEGYDHALIEVFGDEIPPHRSSLSKTRKNVSWEFFRDQLLDLIQSISGERTTFNGLKIFAIDGHQLVLPYTKDIYDAGYSGRYLEGESETYLLRAYMSHCYDVLTGITAGVTFSPLLNEHRDRKILLNNVPDGSLVLYDRSYFSTELVASHAGRDKVYFLARCKRTSREVEDFFADDERISASTRRYARRVYFFKVFHPETNEVTVFATDLPETWHRVELFIRLYRTRWEIETEQRDITKTVKLEQWHSTSINGILQEFYATMWLVNAVRVAMALAGAKSVSPIDDIYEKANFKLCFNFFVKRLSQWLEAPAALIVKLAAIVRRSTEKRQHHSRFYPRVLKSPESAFARNNTVESRARPPPGR